MELTTFGVRERYFREKAYCYFAIIFAIFPRRNFLLTFRTILAIII